MSEALTTFEALVAALNDHDYERAYALYDAEAVHAGQPGPARGIGEMRALDAAFFSAFPDHHRTIEHVVVGQGAVAACLRVTGTNTRPGPGGPPTGRRLDLPVCNVVEVREGRIASMRQFWDGARVRDQLGVSA